MFYQQPNASDNGAKRLQPLEATLFNSAYDKDAFESTAWTVNGKFGPLKAVYTGGYLVRNVHQVGDYTNYARGFYADYYQCYGAGSGDALHPNATCFSPSATWRSVERNTHQQHEFRLSTPDDWRLRAIAGVYWEDNKLYDQTGWGYKTVPSCTTNDPAGYPRRQAQVRFYEHRHRAGRHRGQPRRAGRQHLVLSGHGTRHQADRTLRFGGFRHHPQGINLDCRHSPFPLPKLLRRQRQRQLRLFRRGSAGRRLLGRQLQLERPEPARYGIGIQEPRQSDLAHHAGCHAVLHLLARLQARRIQSERWHAARGWNRRRAAVRRPEFIHFRQIDQQ